jgi:hypothetical protein
MKTNDQFWYVANTIYSCKAIYITKQLETIFFLQFVKYSACWKLFKIEGVDLNEIYILCYEQLWCM